MILHQPKIALNRVVSYMILNFFTVSAASIDLPKNMTLPMPGPYFLILAVLLAFFLIHILFINFTVGGAILSVFYEILGLKNKKHDNFGYVICKTITANKSLAVVMGVGPLLAINVLYTAFFYTANALTGYAWISIVPLVATTFLFIYLHKYTWQKWNKGWKKGMHILIGIIPVATLLFIPLIFLTNINLMLFPHKWSEVHGFFSAVMLSNVFNRYLHFLVASFALTGLFLVWFFKRCSDEYCTENEVDKTFGIQTGYKLFLYFTLSQALFGTLVWWTLPDEGRNLATTIIAFTGASIALIACLMTIVDLRRAQTCFFNKIVILITTTLILMVTGRHIYREHAIKDYRKEIEKKTEEYSERVRQANEST